MSAAWLWIRARPWAMGTIVALAGGFLIMYCRPKATPVPPKERYTIDSLAITKPFFEARVETLTVRETTFVSKASSAAVSASKSSTQAETLTRRADSLEALARATADTATRWYGVALARKAEADTLRTARDSLRVAFSTERMARSTADQRFRDDSTRRAAVEDLNSRLQKDLATAGQCRLFPFIRCPTRKELVIVGIAAVAADHFLQRRATR